MTADSWTIEPDPGAVRAYYDGLDLPVRLLAKRLDRLVRDSLAGVNVGIKWSVPFYFLTGPVCYVSAAKRHVTFGLIHGHRIDDRHGRLAGTGKSPIRKATFRVDDDPEAAVRDWLRQSRKLDRTWGRDRS